MAVEWIDFGCIAREVAEAPKGFPTGGGGGVSPSRVARGLAMFDRRLSLQIDAVHDELERLSCDPSWWAAWRRLYLRFKLRQLERRIS